MVENMEGEVIEEEDEFINIRKTYLKKKLASKKTELYEVDSLQFSILSSEDILKLSETRICNKELYFPMTQNPMPFGVLDDRLGASKGRGVCKTCGRSFQDCCGHWGHVTLHQPVLHVGYFKHLINLLYCVCKTCSRLLLSEEDKKKFLLRSRRCHDAMQRKILLKTLVIKCKRENFCLHPDCRAPQGVLRRVMKPSLDQFMKIVLQKKVRKDGAGSAASRTTIINEDLDPSYIRQLLKRMSAVDCTILDVHLPEKLIISSLLVPPKCIRPSITLGDSGTNEDDLTIVFSEIIDTNNILKAQSQAGVNCPSVLGNWELLQLQCTRFINSEALAVQPLLASKNISFNGRGICQRLKGKEGRFRGNLSGKRVDFSGRTVISPDANCPIPEVIIPMWSAKRLTFPERVCELTIDKLRAAVLRGADEWPGALFVIKKDAGKTSLHFGNRRQIANNLQYGDTVERHLWDGDIVLFNRQPSLHRLSIMAHRARVMPWRTFRFNECVCTPYNADFDGDEMNCHLPQTQEARAEALHLMGVVQNLVTPKNGEPLVAATQDFLSGSYLLTSRDTFMTRDVFCQCCCHFTNAKMHIDLTPPTILKPIELWTGKQLFNTMLRPNKGSCNVVVNFEVRERDFTEPGDGLLDLMCPNEGYVIFDDSELLCGAVAKMTLGNGSKKGLIYNLIRDNTPFLASAFLGRLASLIGRWFSNYGMTIGIDDVTPNSKVSKAKSILLEKGYQDVEKEVVLFKQGRLQPNPGCTLEETLEIRVKSILDELRSIAGKVSNQNLSSTNKPLIMFLSGAKGALINIAQMIALVGQQNVGGQRIQNGFVERTLPHFDHKCQSAKSRGFVAHSFYDGLDPDEFFFHTMSGREGLVDTAVKTAETGYMQRRLVKALEDLSVCYDRTVRTSDGQIVQFVYGDDGLNPTVMERKNCSIPLDKVFRNMASLVYKVNYRTLSAYAEKENEIMYNNEIEERETKIDCSLPIHQDILSSLSAIQQIPKSIAPLCILPPSEKELDVIEKRIQYHIMETQKFLEATNNKTKNFVLGLNSPTTNIVTDVTPEKVNERKRQPLADIEKVSQIRHPCKRIQLVKKSNTSCNGNIFYAQNLISQTTEKVPRLLQQKLMVMESWRRSSCNRYGSLEGLAKLEKDKCYIQAKCNVESHVVVNEWLNVLKQNVPLLPFEILQWAEYLLDRTSELLPEALKEHQNICTYESETHQENTGFVKTFRQELQSWINEKVQSIVKYRCDNFLEPGHTLESYCKALANLREDVPENDLCLPLKCRKVADIADDGSMSHYLCNVYPKNPFLRRLWVLPRNSTSFESSMVKKEKTTSNVLTPLVKQENLDNYGTATYRWKYNRNFWITPKHLLEFFRLAWRRYNRALIEPGEAVGAIGAQSIGEPGTQMTLKTFHFAGVASMNVTLGVPRIKEILNASTKIATPIIQVVLQEDKSFDYAAMVKGRVEKTILRDVCSSLKQVFSPEGAYLAIKIDKKAIARHFLDITTASIREKILATVGLSGTRERLKEENVVVISDCKLRVHLPMTSSFFFDIQLLKQRIQNVRLCGLENIKRGVIKQERRADVPEASKTPLYTYSLAVEGYGLREVMGISGVVGTKCTSNHVMEVRQILGIEAARFVIIDEIRNCMEAYSMDIDCRHMQLLGDVMTFRGDVLGISRFGIQKIRASTLMLASFEETNEHLFEAAAHNREDKIRGVSECIIMGKSIGLGTGSFDLLYNYSHHLTQSISQSLSFHQTSNTYPNSCSSTSSRAALLLSKYTKTTTPISPAVIS